MRVYEKNSTMERFQGPKNIFYVITILFFQSFGVSSHMISLINDNTVCNDEECIHMFQGSRTTRAEISVNNRTNDSQASRIFDAETII